MRVKLAQISQLYSLMQVKQAQTSVTLKDSMCRQVCIYAIQSKSHKPSTLENIACSITRFALMGDKKAQTTSVTLENVARIASHVSQ